MCQALFEGSENTVNIQTEISLLEKGLTMLLVGM